MRDNRALRRQTGFGLGRAKLAELPPLFMRVCASQQGTQGHLHTPPTTSPLTCPPSLPPSSSLSPPSSLLLPLPLCQLLLHAHGCARVDYTSVCAHVSTVAQTSSSAPADTLNQALSSWTRILPCSHTRSSRWSLPVVAAPLCSAARMALSSHL